MLPMLESMRALIKFCTNEDFFVSDLVESIKVCQSGIIRCIVIRPLSSQYTTFGLSNHY